MVPTTTPCVSGLASRRGRGRRISCRRARWQTRGAPCPCNAIGGPIRCTRRRCSHGSTRRRTRAIASYSRTDTERGDVEGHCDTSKALGQNCSTFGKGPEPGNGSRPSGWIRRAIRNKILLEKGACPGYLVFLDWSKAFDKISQGKFIKSLHLRVSCRSRKRKLSD